jgi:hypothetical protein
MLCKCSGTWYKTSPCWCHCSIWLSPLPVHSDQVFHSRKLSWLSFATISAELWQAVHHLPHWFPRVHVRCAYDTVTQKVGTNANGLFKHTFEVRIQPYNAVFALVHGTKHLHVGVIVPFGFPHFRCIVIKYFTVESTVGSNLQQFLLSFGKPSITCHIGSPACT